MAMNLSNFKLLKEDDNSYEIAHPSGKKFTVNKSGLSPKAHDVIKMYANGGEASNAIDQFVNQDQGSSVPDASPAPSQNPPNVDFINSTAQQQGAPAPLPSSGEVGPTTTANGAPNPNNPPAGVAIGDPLLQNKMDQAKILDTKEANEQQFLNSIKGNYGAIAKAQADYQSQADAENKTFAAETAAHKAKDDALLQSYLDKKVDPNRYYNNQSTGSKIAAGIGLILSGAGSAVSGGQNLAMQQINRAVDADIEAQKLDQSKAGNLYQMNRQAYNDDRQAHLATLNQLLTGVQAKIAMSTAGLQGSAAQLQGQQAIQDIESQKSQNRLMQGLYQKAAQGGQGASSLNPGTIIGQVITNPEDQRAASKEIEDSTKLEGLRNMWRKNFEDLNARAASGKLSPSDRQSAIESIAGAIEHITEGRLNRDQAIAQAHAILPGAEISLSNPLGAETASTVKLKRDRGEELFNTFKPSGVTLQKYGLSPNMFSISATTPAPQYKTVNGIKYMRGPNGEAIPVK